LKLQWDATLSADACKALQRSFLPRSLANGHLD